MHRPFAGHESSLLFCLSDGCVIIFYYKLWMIQKYLGFVSGSFAFSFNYFVRSSVPSIESGVYFHFSLPQSLGVTLSSYLSFQWCIPCSSLFVFIYCLKCNCIQHQELRQFVSGHRHCHQRCKNHLDFLLGQYTVLFCYYFHLVLFIAIFAFLFPRQRGCSGIWADVLYLMK